MLTRKEKMLVADVLNGADALMANVPSYLRDMTDGRRLEHEVCDGIEFRDLAKKWGVDGTTLLKKVAAMSPVDRMCLVRAIASAWERNDGNFERDLVALEI